MTELVPAKAQIAALLLEGLKIERVDVRHAQHLAEEALRLSRALGDLDCEARALRNLAYCRFATGTPDMALQLLQEGRSLAESVGAESATALCLHTQGFIQHHLGQLHPALDTYEEVARRREALGERELLAGTLNNLGTIWFNLGDYDSCLTSHRKALQLWRDANNAYGEAITLHNLGNTYSAFGDSLAAILHYQQALQMVEAQGIALLQCEIGTNLARLQRQQGLLKEAQASLDRAAQHLTALKTPQLPQALLLEEQGLLLRQQGELRAARSPLAAALREYRRQRTPIHTTRLLYELGHLHLAAHRPQHACRILLRSLRHAQLHHLKQAERDACGTLADAYETGSDSHTALQFHRRFHALDRELFAESTQRQRLLLIRQIELEKAQRENETLTLANAQLQKLATLDGMTGLQNHRAFQESLRALLSTKTETALLLIDVDHFKDFNDTFGHPAGDEVLRQVAQLLRESVREGDQLGRYGGEEFAVLLPSTRQRQAALIAERIRRTVSNHAFPHRSVTVSIGIATTHQSGHDPAQLIQAADQALYGAKRAGRNRCLKAA